MKARNLTLQKSAINLSKIDSYMQENFERSWERSPAPRYYCGNEGWEWVEKNKPKNFDLAWLYAAIFIVENNVDEKEILNY